MAGATVQILDGSTFVVSDARGDVDASPAEPHGLFHRDTRFLSRWSLTIDGTVPNALSTDDLHYFSAQFFLVPGTGTVYVDAPLSVIRKRSVGNGFHEDLTVMNHGAEPVDLDVRIEAASDFADLFEVKDALAKKGELLPPRRGRPARPRLSARALRPRDLDLRERSRRDRRAGLELSAPSRATRSVVDLPGRGRGRGRHRRDRTPAPSTVTETTGPGRRCS